MSKEDAKKVVLIMATADRGCSTCVIDLLGRFCSVFPEIGIEEVSYWAACSDKVYLTKEEIKERLSKWGTHKGKK